MKKWLLLLFSLTFTFSAIAKLIYIDQFELFVYSFKLFNFDISSILARLLISAELLLGILILFSKTKKTSWWLSVIMLVGFSLFLLIQHFVKPDAHCHCFGEILKMKPLPSFFKNILLIGLLLYVKESKPIFDKIKASIIYVIVFVGICLPFVISQPDFLLSSRSEIVEQAKVDKLKELERVDLSEYFQGKQLICMLSPTCEHCKKAAWKISIMAQKNDFQDNIVFVFIGNKDQIEKFYKETSSFNFPYHIISPKIFLNITNGEMPKIFRLNNGVLEKSYTYRNLSESELGEFFSK